MPIPTINQPASTTTPAVDEFEINLSALDLFMIEAALDYTKVYSHQTPLWMTTEHPNTKEMIVPEQFVKMRERISALALDVRKAKAKPELVTILDDHPEYWG